MGKTIFINARFLSQQVTGVQRFAIELCKALFKIHPNIVLISPTDIIDPKIKHDFPIVQIGNNGGMFWEQFTLPNYLRKKGSPLLINLCNSAPAFYKNNVVTIHDMAFIRHPEWYSKQFAFWYGFLIPRIAKRSRKIVTISVFTKSEIESIWPENKDKIELIGIGIPSVFINRTASGIKKSGPRKVLAVTGNNIRKNPANIIQAFELSKDLNAELVLTGRMSANFGVKQKPGTHHEKIKFIEARSDEDLIQLYQSADVLVYPSKYEGFGLPPLEALALGCPSILTDIPVFRENYDQCAHFISSDSPEAILEGIERILGDESYRNSLVQHGQNLLRKHTFNHVAEKLLSCINTLEID